MLLVVVALVTVAAGTFGNVILDPSGNRYYTSSAGESGYGLVVEITP